MGILYSNESVQDDLLDEIMENFEKSATTQNSKKIMLGKFFKSEFNQFSQQHPELKGYTALLAFKKEIISTPKYITG